MKPNPKATELEGLIANIVDEAISTEGTAYRAVGIEYANQRDLISGEGTKRHGGRWTPPGSFETVHASLELTTALAESLGTQRHYAITDAARLPLVLVAIDFKLHAVMDLTDIAILEAIGLTRRRLLRCRWQENMDRGQEALTQAIGRLAFEQGLEGLIVPSAQRRRSNNLIVFPRALQEGSFLAIQNVKKLPSPPG